MALFKPAVNTSAYLKAGIMGFAGSGKTFTATEIAAGLVELGRKLDLPFGKKPILFLDTETGSDWVLPRMKERGIDVMVAKTRAFKDLLEAVPVAAKDGSVLLIDSITHIWRDLCASFLKDRKLSRLEIHHWTTLKEEWGRFTDLYVNSAVHIVLCGRAGYEFNFFTDEEGKRQLEKTGVKMAVEKELGYEPSLLLLMERESNPADLSQVRRVCSVLKDRADKIDGKKFNNPKFADFQPHIEFLNLGGQQLGVDTSRTSEGMFPESGDSTWRHERKQAEICCEEIQEELLRKWPGQDAVSKAKKAEMVEHLFGTRSWKAVEAKKLGELQAGRDLLWIELRGHRYGEKPDSPGEPVGLSPAAVAAVQAQQANLPGLPEQL